jgi:DNA modification methylase
MSLTLHQGDCRTILPELREGSAQCCITSPPYWNPDRGSAERYIDEIAEAFGHVRRVLCERGTLWLVLGGDCARSVADALAAGGWHMVREYVWEESADLRQWVFAMTRNRATALSNMAEGVWRFATPEAREDYPWSVLPEELAARCVEASTMTGEVVLDPYCGLGTVGVASLRRGRAFVGIERERRVLQLAWARLRNVTMLR